MSAQPRACAARADAQGGAGRQAGEELAALGVDVVSWGALRAVAQLARFHVRSPLAASAAPNGSKGTGLGAPGAGGAGGAGAASGGGRRGEWMVGFYAATTEPGLKALQERSFAGDKGCAVLKPGQYSYCIGQHAYLYTALCQAGKVNVWRNPQGFGTSLDANYGSGKGVITEEGHFGINIHRASPVGGVRRVDDYSAGCQVMQHSEDFEVFMMDARIHADRFGNSFLYALFDCSDILFWQNAPLPHETTFETMCRVVTDSVFREKRNALYRKVAQGLQESVSYLTARPGRILEEHVRSLAPPVLDAAAAFEGARRAAGDAGARAADLVLGALNVPRRPPSFQWPARAQLGPGQIGAAKRAADEEEAVAEVAWAAGEEGAAAAPRRALLLASEGAAQCMAYTVEEGEYAAKIAYKLRVDFDDLVELNPRVDLEFLDVGQKILVPSNPRW